MSRPPLDPIHQAALESRETAIKEGLEHLFEFWEHREDSKAQRCLIDAKVCMKSYSQSKPESFPNAEKLQKADCYFYRAYSELGLVIQGEELILKKLLSIIEDLRNALGFVRACINWCIPPAKGQSYRFPVVQDDIDIFRQIDTFIEKLSDISVLLHSHANQSSS